MVTDFRLSPALTARLLGVTLLGGAALVVIATLAIAIADMHSVFLVVPVVVVAVAMVALMVWSNTWVLRLSEEGYQVRRIRSAGTTAAPWRDVEDLTSGDVDGVPCLLLRLRDGRSTTLPLGALHVDGQVLASKIAEHLNRANGLRKLG